jgi:hypothetical protein
MVNFVCYAGMNDNEIIKQRINGLSVRAIARASGMPWPRLAPSW